MLFPVGNCTVCQEPRQQALICPGPRVDLLHHTKSFSWESNFMYRVNNHALSGDVHESQWQSLYRVAPTQGAQERQDQGPSPLQRSNHAHSTFSHKYHTGTESDENDWFTFDSKSSTEESENEPTVQSPPTKRKHHEPEPEDPNLKKRKMNDGPTIPSPSPPVSLFAEQPAPTAPIIPQKYVMPMSGPPPPTNPPTRSDVNFLYPNQSYMMQANLAPSFIHPGAGFSSDQFSPNPSFHYPVVPGLIDPRFLQQQHPGMVPQQHMSQQTPVNPNSIQTDSNQRRTRSKPSPKIEELDYVEGKARTRSSSRSSSLRNSLEQAPVLLQMPKHDLLDDDDDPKKKRSRLPANAVSTFRQWFFNHLDKPYPSEEEKEELARKTGLRLVQVNNWFTNARRRIVPRQSEEPNGQPQGAPQPLAPQPLSQEFTNGS